MSEFRNNRRSRRGFSIYLATVNVLSTYLFKFLSVYIESEEYHFSNSHYSLFLLSETRISKNYFFVIQIIFNINLFYNFIRIGEVFAYTNVNISVILLDNQISLKLWRSIVWNLFCYFLSNLFHLFQFLFLYNLLLSKGLLLSSDGIFNWDIATNAILEGWDSLILIEVGGRKNHSIFFWI